MTGRQLFQQALQLLGYTNNFGISNESALMQRGLGIVNAIYSDLFYACGKKEFKPVPDMDSEIILPERVLNDCFVYGLAMMLAQSENDGDNQQLYAALYNQKRAACTHISNRLDVLPDIWG